MASAATIAAPSDPRSIPHKVAGFIDHLRINRFPLGPRETELALTIMAIGKVLDNGVIRTALKTALCGDHQQWQRFDDLFEAYWFARGRVRQRMASPDMPGSSRPSRPRIWDTTADADRLEQTPAREQVAEGDGESTGGSAMNRLVGDRRGHLARKDLRYVVDQQEMQDAGMLAWRMARALRVQRSRRRRSFRTGEQLDLRRIIRKSLGHGGEPVELVHRRKPERPAKIVILLDVSGSMQQYSRFFLQFTRGLVDCWLEADAFVFHTRLLNVSDALRERDPMRAMMSLSLMTKGFGGGTKIAGSLRMFNSCHAARTLNSRSVVIILSDGYDTDEPDDLARELIRLRRKARRIVWLNPLLGWRDYEPIARAMAAAMPYLDCFAPASTLEELAAVEPILSRLQGRT